MPGVKEKTTFFGSVNYCSPDLLATYKNKSDKEAYVDLHFNDVHCLQVSMKEILFSLLLTK